MVKVTTRVIGCQDARKNAYSWSCRLGQNPPLGCRKETISLSLIHSRLVAARTPQLRMPPRVERRNLGR